MASGQKKNKGTVLTSCFVNTFTFEPVFVTVVNFVSLSNGIGLRVPNAKSITY